MVDPCLSTQINKVVLGHMTADDIVEIPTLFSSVRVFPPAGTATFTIPNGDIKGETKSSSYDHGGTPTTTSWYGRRVG